MFPSGDIDVQTSDEIELALDLLLEHKLDFTKSFLKERQIHHSGTKLKLRERLSSCLATGQITFEDIVALLNTIEGWGDHHVYFYRGHDHLLTPWQNINTAMAHLNSIDSELVSMLNRPLPLVLPDETKLSSIELSNSRLRLVWIEKRESKERLGAEDKREGDILWQAYRVKTLRGLVAFDWNLVANDAMLMIHTLPSGIQYKDVRDEFEARLTELVNIRQFDPIRVAGCIAKINDSVEVRRRHLEFLTANSGTIKLTSSDTLHDTSEDPILEQTQGVLENESSGLLGHLYWRPTAGLSQEVNCKIYGTDDIDQRVSITGEHREQDVRYVLSRIRNYCG